MGSSDMHDAFPIMPPSDSRLTAHFSKKKIDVIHIGCASGFKNAIGNATPCIVKREFHFNPERRQNDIGKYMRMRTEIDRKSRILKQCFQEFTCLSFKSRR